jgi:Serine aminopeptidase, S33
LSSTRPSQELIIETSAYTREDTTFESGGRACATWLYRPDSVERPPIIVMAHGFAAMRALRLAAYAERFAESGFAVLVFDYRGWGDSAGEPRRVLDIGGQQDDWRAALAFARELDGVDTSHVAAWGSSFRGRARAEHRRRRSRTGRHRRPGSPYQWTCVGLCRLSADDDAPGSRRAPRSTGGGIRARAAPPPGGKSPAPWR